MSLILKKTGLDQEEGRRAALMFGYIFLIIASLLIVKPVRNSIFLSQLGARQLPYAFILAAAVSALVASVYSRLAGRFALNRLISVWLLFSTLLFLASWALLCCGVLARWFVYGLYVWVAIFGVISASQFWLLAHYVFDAREAKRVFGLLGAGGIAGGIFGGYLTRSLAPILGTEHLVLLCVAPLWGCLLLLWLVWTKPVQESVRASSSERRRMAPSADRTNPTKLIRGSRHLTYIAALIGVGVVAASLIDYQFNAIASRAINNQDQLTAFFGFWYSNLNIISLAIQLFLTALVLRRFGVGTSLYLLPGAIFVGALTILLFPVLAAAVLVKVCEGGFKQSINKAGMELLGVPIPSWIKNQTKTVVDVFVDNAAVGIGGVLLLLLTIVLGLGVRHISVVLIALVALWIVLIYLAKREYVNSFRLAVEKRSLDMADSTINLNDASVLQIIRRVFEGNNERQILYLLRMVEKTSYDVIAPFFERLIQCPSSQVKAQVLRMAANATGVDLTEAAKTLVGHADAEVRVQAIQYLCRASSDPGGTLEGFLKDEDMRVQTAAMLATAKEFQHNPLVREAVDIVRSYKEVFERNGPARLSDSEARFLKVGAAQVIGTAQVPKLNSFLHGLLEDTSEDVLQAAVVSAGRTRDPEFIPKLVEHLGTRPVRRYARDALAQYGEVVIESLIDRFNSPGQSADVQYGAIRVLGMIESQRSVNILLGHADQENPKLRFEITKALSDLRGRFPSLEFDAQRVEELIVKEVEACHTLLAILRQHQKMSNGSGSDSFARVRRTGSLPAQRLLQRAIQERLDKNRERMFLLLGLKYPPVDIQSACQGCLSRTPRLRANAVEFLDNLLDHPLKRHIMPAIETRSTEESVHHLPADVARLLESDYLAVLLKGLDNWLKACALFVVAKLQEPRFLPVAVEHTHSTVPIIKETAEYAVRELGVPQ